MNYSKDVAPSEIPSQYAVTQGAPELVRRQWQAGKARSQAFIMASTGKANQSKAPTWTGYVG